MERRPSCRALVLFANLCPVVLKFRSPWHDWADDVRGQPIDCGHHIAEEAPDELANLLAEFFTQPQTRTTAGNIGAQLAMPTVFKSVRNSPSDTVATCTYGALTRHVAQDHPAYIPRSGS